MFTQYYKLAFLQKDFLLTTLSPKNAFQIDSAFIKNFSSIKELDYLEKRLGTNFLNVIEQPMTIYPYFFTKFQKLMFRIKNY